MNQDSICMQYKATHPLWGMRDPRAHSGDLLPQAFTNEVRERMLADFRKRCAITASAWDALGPVLVYELREDLGVDSYFAIGFEGELPEGNEYAGLTLPQVLRALRVQVALAKRDK